MCFDSDLRFIHFSLLCNILVCSHVLIHSPLGGYLGFFQFFFLLQFCLQMELSGQVS